MQFQVQVSNIPNQEVVEEMRAKRVLFEGHYILRNGLHSNVFVYPRNMNNVFLARKRLMFVLKQLDYDAQGFLHVCMGKGSTRIIRSVFDLYKHPPKSFVWPDVVSGEMVFKEKDLDRLQTQPFLVVDDVLRQGVALRKLLKLCEQQELTPHGVVVGFSAPTRQIQGLRVSPVAKYDIQQWKAEECPLCAKGEPVYDPYHFTRS